MELTKRSALIIVSAVAVITFTSTFGASVFELGFGWHSEQLGPTSVDDGFYELAMNSKGHLQLAYIGIHENHYSLMYGERSNGKWNLVPVARLAYDYYGVSMALDSQDSVHICTLAYSFTNHVLYATNAGGSWSIQMFNVSYHCTSSAVAVDAQDRVHLLYTRSSYNGDPNGNTSIVELTRSAQGWSTTTLRFSNGTGNQQYINDADARPDGSIGILYTESLGREMYDSEAVEYQNYSILTEKGFQADETVVGPADFIYGRYSLCHDTSGHAYLTSVRKNGDSYSVCYSTNKEGPWIRVDVGYAGGGGGFNQFRPGGTAISVDSEGFVHVGYHTRYYDGTRVNDTVRYSTNRGGEWSMHILDHTDGWDMDTIDLTTDAEHRVHIAYFQRTENPGHGELDVSVYTTNEPDQHLAQIALSNSGLVALPFTALAVLTTALILRAQTKLARNRQWMDDSRLYER